MKRVLIVDDKEENLYYLESLLSGHGYEVSLARHGAEALVKARQRTPELIISDLLMPVMDGYTLLRHWKADSRLKTIPFIVYTATYTEAEDERLALSLGADAFLLKPTEPDEFLVRIREFDDPSRVRTAPKPESTAEEGQQSALDENGLLRVYSEALIRKLEEKMLQLEETNRELRASEERFRAFMDHCPAAAFIKDGSGHFVYTNPAWREQFSTEPKDWLGKTDFDFWPPESAEVFRKSDHDCLIRDVVIQTEETAKLPDGSERSWIVMKYPVETGHGRGVGGMAWDVTQQRLANQKLREQATLLDKAQDAILVRDLNHRVSYWNKSAERLYGWTAEEAIGRCVHEFLYKERQAFLSATRTTLEKGEWIGEIEQLSKNGKALTIEGRWTLVRDNEGRPSSILAINTDITERKRIEQQFLRAQRMESIGTLAGGIAHDLNNALTPILISIELFRMDERDPERLQILSTIESNVRHGADLLKQVLAFARGVEGDRKWIDPSVIVRELQPIIRDTFPKNIEFRFEAPSDLWKVHADATQLHQVLMNLCVNARDAMPSGGFLRVILENTLVDEVYSGMNPNSSPGPHVHISVRDSGTGMSENLQERIFDPFFTTKATGQGTGLGLPTVLTIVKSHGGFLNVESEPDKGTAFNVYLPANPDGVKNNEAVAPSEPLLTGNGELIMIVDDEDSIRSATQRTLERFGYRVLLASNGAEAVSLYARHGKDIALVITDMAMPVMDGPATIAALTAMNPDVKIVGSSGHSSDSSIQRSVGSNVHQFLAKPFTSETLLRVIAQNIRHRV